MLKTWVRSAVGLLQESEQHPFATRRGLVDALVALPTGMPHEALQDIGDWYQSLDVPELPWDAQVAALIDLDEVAWKCTDDLWFRLHASSEGEDLFDRYRLALSNYTSAFSEQVARLLAAHAALPEPQTTQTAAALVLCGRAVMAMGSLKRARYLRRDRVPGEYWRRLYELFQFARRHGATAREIGLYRGDAPTTIVRELLRVLALDTAPLQNLTWRQMELVDATIRELRDRFVVRGQGNELAPYWVDLGSTTGPQRLRDSSPPAGAVALYFGPGTAYVEAVKLYKTAVGRRPIPEWLIMPLADGVDTEVELTEALDLTLRHWSRNPPTRQAERRPASGTLQVVNGFRQARRYIALDELARRGQSAEGVHSARPAEESAPRPPEPARASADTLRVTGESDLTERWELCDESESGLGAVVSGRPNWLRVGTLVGHRRDSEPPSAWDIAVIRRIGRDSRARPLAGMHRIPGRWELARFVSSETADDNPWVAQYEQSGCPVYDALADAGAARLITDNRRFAPGLIGILRRGKGELHIRLVELGGRGGDYEWWTYEPALADEWDAARVAAQAKHEQAKRLAAAQARTRRRRPPS